VADRVAVVVGHWCGALAASARFDLIVSNPPYVATAELAGLAAEVRAEPVVALDGGVDGLAAYRALVPAAAGMLASGGRFLVEVGASQAEAVVALFVTTGLGAVACYDDLGGTPRVVGGYAAAITATRVEVAV
jgi:release factor glutamine methyltransferase